MIGDDNSSSSKSVVVTAHLRFTSKDGGHAEVMRVNGDQIELRTTMAAPPGAPLEATLDSDVTVTVKIKSHGTRKEKDLPEGAAPTFTLTGRLVSASRELRERLAVLASSKL